jgi:hypothetical protein
MLVIKIELWPFGDETQKRMIAEGYIINNGSGNTELGNYDAKFWSERHPTEKNGKVKSFPRQTQGVWKLLWMALGSAFVWKKAAIIKD